MRQHIHAILFDAFGTLVDWRSGVARAWGTFAERRGITLDAEDFAMQWRAKYQPAIATVRSGEREYAPLDQLHLENLLEVLTENGVGTRHIPPESLTWLNQSWQRLDPWPDSVSGMKMLKKRFLVGALSNANISLLTQLARYARLPWDVAIGSDLLGAYKPDPAAYRRAAQLLDLPPHAIMLCAAHNHDLAAARAAGYQTAFVCRPAEYGPGQQRDLAPTDDWDVIATSLSGLAENVLGRLSADRESGQLPWGGQNAGGRRLVIS